MGLYYILKSQVRLEMLKTQEISGNLPEEKKKQIKLKKKPPSLNCSFPGAIELIRFLFLHQHFLLFHQPIYLAGRFRCIQHAPHEPFLLQRFLQSEVNCWLSS